jgi:hypothetical protein
MCGWCPHGRYQRRSAAAHLPCSHECIIMRMLSLQGKGGEDVTMETAKDDAAEAGFVPPESAGSGKPEGGSPLVRTSEVGSSPAYETDWHTRTAPFKM